MECTHARYVPLNDYQFNRIIAHQISAHQRDIGHGILEFFYCADKRRFRIASRGELVLLRYKYKDTADFFYVYATYQSHSKRINLSPERKERCYLRRVALDPDAIYFFEVKKISLRKSKIRDNISLLPLL